PSPTRSATSSSVRGCDPSTPRGSPRAAGSCSTTATCWCTCSSRRPARTTRSSGSGVTPRPCPSTVRDGAPVKMLRAPRTRVSVSILSTHHRSREGGPDAKRSTGVLQEALAREAAPAGGRGRPDGALRQGPGRRLDQGPRRPGEYRVQPGVLLRTRQRRPAPAARCRLRPAEAGGRRLWCVRAVRRGDLREATRGAAVRALLHRLPAGHRARGAHGHGLGARGPASRRQPAHPARAAEVSRAGRSQESGTLYRQILQTRKSHLGALRGLRDLAAAAGRWAEALDLEQRIVGAVAPAERSPETEWLAVIHYELG